MTKGKRCQKCKRLHEDLRRTLLPFAAIGDWQQREGGCRAQTWTWAMQTLPDDAFLRAAESYTALVTATVERQATRPR